MRKELVDAAVIRDIEVNGAPAVPDLVPGRPHAFPARLSDLPSPPRSSSFSTSVLNAEATTKPRCSACDAADVGRYAGHHPTAAPTGHPRDMRAPEH
jgi:hypothetical protein